MEVLWRGGHRLTFPAVWFQSQRNDPQPSVPNQPQTLGQGLEMTVTQSPVALVRGLETCCCLVWDSPLAIFGSAATTLPTDTQEEQNSLLANKKETL